MAAQFNLLMPRFSVIGPSLAYGSTVVQGGRNWIGLTVRRGFAFYVDKRRVKGVELTEFN